MRQSAREDNRIRSYLDSTSTTPREAAMPFFDIPQDCSAEQAIIVCDFLAQLRESILLQYHDDICNYFQPEGLNEDCDNDPHDPRTAIPFDDEITF
jgi:hypothetical protein